MASQAAGANAAALTIRGPLLDARRLVSAVFGNDLSTILDVLSAFPPDDPLVKAMMTGPELLRWGAIQRLAHWFRSSGDAITASALGSALLDVIGEALENGRIQDPVTRWTCQWVWRNTLSFVLTTSNIIGRHADLLTRASAWADTLEKMTIGHAEVEHIRTLMLEQGLDFKVLDQATDIPACLNELRLSYADALILAGEYEHAADVIKHVPPTERLPPALRMARQNIDKAIDDLLRRPDQKLKATVVNWEADRGEMLKVVSEVTGQAFQDDNAASFNSALRHLGFSVAPGAIDDLLRMAESLHDAGNPFHALAAVMDRTVELIHPETQMESAALEKLARIALLTANYAKQLDFWTDMIKSRWLHAHLLRRLGQIDSLADVLRDLRDTIERRRLRIRDPHLRAGLTVYQEHLYESSARVAIELGEKYKEELFAIIEGAKSRILADLVEQKSAPRPVDLRSEELRDRESAVLEGLRELLAQSSQRAHFLSYLVDDNATYCVLLDHSGTLHTDTVALGAAALLQLVGHIGALADGDRLKMDLSAPIDPADPWKRPFNQVINRLSPLVDIVARLREKDVIQRDDVLCYAPDGILFNLPLQMLKLNGVDLGEEVALSCAPSAQMLLTMAHAGRRPRHAVTVVAPRNVKEEASLRRGAVCLARYLPTKVVDRESGIWVDIQHADLTDAIVDFSMHGDFSLERPLERSGLATAAHLITPNDIAKLDLSGSHVTLRACVSGRVTQITSREALGFLWAFLQAGASSVLATAWHANAPSSGRYVEVFYHNWMNGRCRGKATANAQAMAAVKADGRAWAHPYHWSPFIFCGHWSDGGRNGQ